MKGRTIIILAISLILAISSHNQAGIVAFGGHYNNEHFINLNETNRIILKFSNIIYWENSTIQWKILPAPGNALYIDSEGKQNISWGVYLTVKHRNEIILSQILTDTIPSKPVLIGYEQKVDVEIEIIMPRYISEGRYCVMLMILSNGYMDWERANQASQGIEIGADITESLSCKHFINVERLPVESEDQESFPLLFLGTVIIALLIIFIIFKLIIKGTMKHEN